jgi:hypothetical protein
MIEDKVIVTGALEIVLRDSNGNIKEELLVPNLVVRIGKSVIASRLTGVSTPVMSFMALGTSSTAPAITDTALGAEMAGSRTAMATSGGVATSNVVTYVASFGPGVGTGTIFEAGIFNASSVGSMLCRTTFSVVNKGSADSLTITWNVSIN